VVGPGYPLGMTQTSAPITGRKRPTLIYFSSVRSGPARRTEAFLDQVLQARRNHATFERRVVDVDRRPDLAERFEVRELPTIVVVDEGRVATRLEGRKGVAELRAALGPWLR
jgi:thioredoxin 2